MVGRRLTGKYGIFLFMHTMWREQRRDYGRIPDSRESHRTLESPQRPLPALVEGSAELSLELQPITFRECVAFVKTYHRHHDPPPESYGIVRDGRYYDGRLETLAAKIKQCS